MISVTSQNGRITDSSYRYYSFSTITESILVQANRREKWEYTITMCKIHLDEYSQTITIDKLIDIVFWCLHVQYSDMATTSPNDFRVHFSFLLEIQEYCIDRVIDFIYRAFSSLWTLRMNFLFTSTPIFESISNT